MYKNSFKYQNLKVLVPDSARIDITRKNLKPISKEVYTAIVQNDSLSKNYEPDKYYFYSFQDKYKDFVRIIVANDLEIYIELESFQFDLNGKLLDRRLLVASGGDYAQWVISSGSFTSDTLFEARWKSGGDEDNIRFKDSLQLYILDSKITFQSDGRSNEQRAEYTVWEKRQE
jgi:hypothetical protein